MAIRQKISEVKDRLAFVCPELLIRELLELEDGDVNRTVFYIEEATARFRSTGIPGPYYLGEKPANSTPKSRKKTKHIIERDYCIKSGDIIVSVQVGTASGAASPSPKIFKVHQAVLCSSSEFFKSKAKPEWSQGNAAVDLSHISEEAFQVYVNWLYRSKVMPNGKKLWKKGTAADSSDWLILAECVTLGEELMDKAFQHSAMDVMVVAARAEKAKETVRDAELHAAVRIVYDGTPEHSGARNLLVDIFKYHSGLLESCGDNELPASFVRTLALESLNMSEGLAE